MSSEIEPCLIPFAFGLDAEAQNVEVLSGRNDSRLILPLGDLPVLRAALLSFDPKQLLLERPCLELSE